MEEVLFENLQPVQEIFLLYVNKPCVVIGRHQNPWKETKPMKLARQGIPLLRRISGGGTVWHDLGNINFSWLGPKQAYDRSKVDRWIASALADFGIRFDISSKGDYLYKGAKFSGNAFAFHSDRVLHHGTLLVSAQIQSLEDFMGGIPVVQSLGVPSRPAVVMNLNELDPRLDVPSLIEVLIKKTELTPSALPSLRDDERLRLRADKEWILGQTPRFQIRTAGDEITEVIHGKIGQEYFNEELLV